MKDSGRDAGCGEARSDSLEKKKRWVRLQLFTSYSYEVKGTHTDREPGDWTRRHVGNEQQDSLSEILRKKPLMCIRLLWRQSSAFVGWLAVCTVCDADDCHSRRYTNILDLVNKASKSGQLIRLTSQATEYQGYLTQDIAHIPL